MPSTNEGVAFNEFGLCTACISQEEKMRIDWVDRKKELDELLEHYKSLNNSYDCIVPISGGKDSTFQLHVLTKVYGLRVLAVTFSHNWFTETGKYNLENALEKFNVDHIMFTPARKTVNQLAKKSLSVIGDACWHCHSGVGSFPLKVALDYKVPLLIWGESINETSGRSTYKKSAFSFDENYFTKVSSKADPSSMLTESMDPRELDAFRVPDLPAPDSFSIKGIHLGDFLFWDDERQMEFVRDVYGWREDVVQGTYKRYKSVECKMAGVHDYTKFMKRGFSRTTDHVSMDVRAGLLTREQGEELISKLDGKRPDALDFYLEITGLSEDEFNQEMARHRTKIETEMGVNGEISKLVNLRTEQSKASAIDDGITDKSK
jgi:N-acetyl sugar amidotransferase